MFTLYMRSPLSTIIPIPIQIRDCYTRVLTSLARRSSPSHIVTDDWRDSDDSDSEESAIGSPTPFKLRAPQPRAVTLIPSVHVESAGTPSPEPSPRYPVDRSLLSPPEHRRFTSRPRTPKPRRPASAPPTIVTFDNQVTCFVENWEQEPQEETRRSSLQDLRPGDLIRPTPLLCKYIHLHDLSVA